MAPGWLKSEPVPVRHSQGLLHGFLSLSEEGGKVLAYGDLLQTVDGRRRVTIQLIFHFKDGSLHEETAIYSQRRTFQLLHYHLIQKGKAFKDSVDFSLNVPTGEANTRIVDEAGKTKTVAEHMKLPDDLANGIVPMLLLQIDHEVAKTALSMVVLDPKPRLVKLEVKPSESESFALGFESKKAICYTISIELGGIAKFIAPLIGKQPPDVHTCLIGGKAPGFLTLDTALFLGGPVWHVQLVSPVWNAAQ